MTATRPADDQLFRQFRRSWMPVWLERMFGGFGPLTQLIIIGTLAIGLSWAALTYLPRSTGQQVASVESWRQRIDSAEEAELVPVFQSLFQVRNDRVIDLGVNYMLSADASRREAARVALEDSVKVWKTWDNEESTPHIHRVSDSLARQVLMFNAPEQASAVEVARQFLLWPTADRKDHSELLLSCETIFRNAREAFSQRPELERATNAATEPQLSASDQVAASLLEDRPDTFVAGRDPGFFSVGYRRPTQPVRTNLSSQEYQSPTEVRDSLESGASVPMLDEQGQRLGVRTVDPSTLDLPGGMIPVQLTGDRKRSSARTLPIGEPTVEFEQDVPRQSINDVLQQRNEPSPAIVPGDREEAPSPSQRDFIAGDDFEVLKPLLSSNGRLRNELGSSPREEVTPAPRRLDRSLMSENSATGVLPLPHTVENDPSTVTGPRAGEPTFDQLPGRGVSSWQPPNKPLRDWAHIDVMNMLQSTTPREVTAAETELLRRGFGRSHIAVAYRLTSQDPLERYNLVFDLVKSQRVEPIPFLKWLSDDRHPEVRTAATQQLQLLTEQPLR